MINEILNGLLIIIGNLIVLGIVIVPLYWLAIKSTKLGKESNEEEKKEEQKKMGNFEKMLVEKYDLKQKATK